MTDSPQGLVERLRDVLGYVPCELGWKAADRIEALERENAALREDRGTEPVEDGLSAAFKRGWLAARSQPDSSLPEEAALAAPIPEDSPQGLVERREWLIDRLRDCYDGIPVGEHVTTAPVPLLVLAVDYLERTAPQEAIRDALRKLLDAVYGHSAQLVKTRGMFISEELAEAANEADDALAARGDKQ